MRHLTCTLLLLAALLAAACSTPAPQPSEPTTPATSQPGSAPMQTDAPKTEAPDLALRAGRVSKLQEDLWVITPEDNPNTRICLQGELAEAFKTEGLRIQFRATVHPPKPNERRACHAAEFKFIADLAEGAAPDDSDIDYDESDEGAAAPGAGE